jgi:hypothetical protein
MDQRASAPTATASAKARRSASLAALERAHDEGCFWRWAARHDPRLAALAAHPRLARWAS